MLGRRISRWVATVGALVALGGVIAGCGDDPHSAATDDTPAATAPGSATTTTGSSKPDDGRTGGTPDVHEDKPGESK